jgi:lipopolysaccharide/colanic/teichoic acid biosynthesis glycosyltransferase
MIQTLQHAQQVAGQMGQIAGQVSAQSARAVQTEPAPTIWGLAPQQIHDAFWRSKGVQCVRRGQRQPMVPGAELFLLLEPDQLVVFNISAMTDRLQWHNATVTRLHILDESEQDYSEHVVVDDRGLVQRIERRYRAHVRGSSRVMLTSSKRIASIWMAARSRREGWDRARRSVAWARVDHRKIVGRTFIAGDRAHERQLLDDLVERWATPDQSIVGVQELSPGVWSASGETSVTGAVRVGPLWLGQGAGSIERRCLVGPAWLADESSPHQPLTAASLRDISEVELPDPTFDEEPESIPTPGGVYAVGKRAFDIVASIVALALLFPVMCAVGFAVWLESGRPLFFGHERQGRHGRAFKCWKFRTMRRDAHKMARLLHDNQCDGPQVNIKNDPRVTKVGRILRKSNLDELPQFWNVLVGDMSLVGPRPSPDDENQYCPAWRDLRLSVRPGITGLWQLKRTREPGEDFQEWIKYDIEYVQRASFRLDLIILFRTALLMLRGRTSSAAE